ncbi:MAG: hypothetical protein ACLGG0_10705 [Bacteriovoracia bacterium]
MRQQLFILLSLWGLNLTHVWANSAGLEISWSCPQQQYAGIKRLPDLKQIKISFAEFDGELSAKLKPNIFDVKPSSVTIEYTECLNKLKENLVEEIAKFKKTAVCEKLNPIECNRSQDDLIAALTREIKNGKFFKLAPPRVLPRQLPGSEKAGLTYEISQKAITDFCTKGELSSEVLFSTRTLSNIVGSSNYTNLPPGLVCLNNLKAELEKQKLNLVSNGCPEPKQLCQQINDSVKRTGEQLDKAFAAKTKAVAASDKNWEQITGLAFDNEEVLNLMLARLDKEPAQCNQLTEYLSYNERSYPLSNFPNSFAKYATKLSEKVDADCLRQLTQNYAASVSSEFSPDREIYRYCQEHASPVCEQMKAREPIHHQNIRQLLAIGYGDVSQQLEESCDDCDQSPASQLKDLLSKIKDNKEAMACLELKPGQTKVVSFRDGTPTGITGNYSLTKNDDGSFDIGVAMKFPDDDTTKMMAKVQSCISSVTPFLKGPQGQVLNFKILSTSDVAKLPSAHRPMINNVAIQAPNSRSNSASYAANIDCPTITHEVLHLTGLCDEYDGTNDGYTCRATPKIDSVMSNQRNAFRRGMPETLTCECRSDVCTKIMGGQDNLKRDILISRSIYEVTDYQLRNKHCQFVDLPNVNWNPEGHSIPHIINKRTDNEITILSYSINDNANKVSQTKLVCKCSDSSECEQDITSLAQSVEKAVKDKHASCPGSSNLVASEKGLPTDLNSNYNWNGKRFTLAKLAEWPSILHPQHFERIVGGACPKAAQKYSECAQWAYRKKQDTNNCQGKPAYCDSDKEFLGVSQ